MLLPKWLKSGDTIGITCPSGYVSEERVAYAVTMLERWEFKVKKGKTVGNEYFYFSGTDKERRDDLQAMLDDPDVAAILMGRGGYGMSRIIDSLDFTEFLKHPKWVCGFSDITVLHSHILAQYGYASLHSPMCGAFRRDSEHEAYLLSFYNALTGNTLKQHIPPSSFNRAGTATGTLTGGNLAILAHLTGSVSEVDTSGKVLFIEEIGEHLYGADRMLMNLKRAGKLDNLAALIVGSFTEMEDTKRPFGQSIEEIIADKVKEYNYPVCFNIPVGHQEVNYTLLLGTTYTIDVSEAGATLSLSNL